MATLNKKAVSKNTPTTVNRAGGAAFSQSPELELASILLTSFFAGGDTFYEGHDERLDRLASAIDRVDPLFAAKAAVYARDRFGMRTSSHLVAAALGAKKFVGKGRFFDKIVVRPDDMLEITAKILNDQNGADAKDQGKLPNALKRGFAKALGRFDEYALGKYRGEGKVVNLRDLVNMVHPKSTPALAALMKGTLAAPETFETRLTRAGQIDEETAATMTAEEKAAKVEENKGVAWRDLVMTGKIGYFALLRNLRNIFAQADAETQKRALELLVDEKLIRKSRVMPFRFLTAAYELQREASIPNSVVTALARALDVSLGNAPEFGGSTLIAVDESGSMQSENGRSSITNRDMALAFAMAFAKRNGNCDVMSFSEDAKYVRVDLSSSVLSLIANFPLDPKGTNFHAVFERAVRKYDRIVIISDEQGWMPSTRGRYVFWLTGQTYRIDPPEGGAPMKALAAYRAKFDANPFIYSWDIAGMGDMMFPEEKVVCLVGWMGDKVFDLMSTFENGFGSIVDEIKKVEI